MDKQNSMSITLELFPNSLQAQAVIACPGNTEKELAFMLNQDLVISSITAKNCSLSYEKATDIALPFRPPCQKITVKCNTPFTEICIRYYGGVQFDPENKKNWYNIITEDYASLSWYSVWFPQDISLDIANDSVTLENGDNWFVLKGKYDEINHTWLYENKGFDPYNIVAYRKDKLQTIANPYFNIYFLDESIKEQALKSQQIYKDILDFYNGGLFEKQYIQPLDVPCAYPFIRTGGGYKRNGLMWCVSPGSNDLETTWLYAHELAHIWCAGADTGSWEDWLNETTAEWATLLFALHTNNAALFDLILKSKTERYHTLPSIKTSDGSRPEGVHDKGTVVFYKIYQEFGHTTMVKLLQCFTRLDEKNTNNFLAGLKSMGLQSVASKIAEELSAG